jgi:hypothetical protein
VALNKIIEATKIAVLGAAWTPSQMDEARGHVLQDLHLTEKAWAAGESQGPWFARGSDHVAFSPTARNGAPLTIGGLTTNFVPAELFADYLVEMRNGIERGDFDGEIEGANHGSSNVSGIADVAMPTARHGDQDEVREEQRVEAMRRDGRNPDGSLIAVVGERAEPRDS